jgi:putative polyketide hydroxylase
MHGPPSFSAEFRSGRAFFAGRAARVLSIPGVVALNLDMQDAHNLAWKLAYVVKGLAGPALLETYEAERKPVVKSVFQHIGRRGDIDRTLGGEVPPFANWMSSAGYHSTAVLAEDGDEPGVHDEDSRTPTGSPGMRVPHVALQRGGHDLSTLDLCGGDFVLLAGADGLAWCDAAERAADGLGIDLEAYCIGAGRDLSKHDERWPAACGLTEAGALLVRPDGYVGWRARAALPYPERVLTEVLARLLSRAEASR